MTTTFLWLQLAASAALILGASMYLARSADVIALKTGLGRSFAGVILLATATSLPELGTGVSSIVLIDQPDLAAGDAFGSNLFNLLIIGLLDTFWRGGPILGRVSPTATLVAALGIVLISLAGLGIVVHHQTTAASGWYLSPVSVALALVFLVAMYMTYRSGQRQEHSATPDEEDKYASRSLFGAAAVYTGAASVIIVAAIWLAHTGEGISEEMGWDASFVGTQFLAVSTSLPELAASFAAIRIGAPELAISNILGSNMFNMGFVLFLDDAAYTKGALWTGVSEIHTLTTVIAMLMTAVVVIALVNRSRTPRPVEAVSNSPADSQRPRWPRFLPRIYWRLEAVVLIGLYVAASLLVFNLS
jgi:cation:H+ antiporter